jgi:serine/threonine-protein kinase
VLGSTLNQRFTLDKELGRGGMGAVYRATDQILQRSVAIKVLKEVTGDEVGRRLRLEAQILARLVNDGIVRIYDFGLDGETYYFVMEEVDGSSFQKRWKRITLADRLRILADVAEALDYAHHQGVIHRDVKPANILLTATDRPKLSDFGLSLLADEVGKEAGTVRGTPHYMSPEQARGRPLDFRTDLYSLGVMLYECATGLPPFDGQGLVVMTQHVNVPPRRPSELNPEIDRTLEALILQLLSKQPEDRPASGLEVASRLRAILDATTPATAPTAPAPASPASESPRPTPAVRPPAARTAPDASGARELIDAVLAEPVLLSADERYLAGHYLAYLLGGSRKRGLLRRRPLDPLNADRARLLLAMAYLTTVANADPQRAARLMTSTADVRPALSPVVVRKYLDGRSTPARRKAFRQARRQLQEACGPAVDHLTDDRGILNPGLMPQTLDDLRRIAPERTEVDDDLVARWNRVSDVWTNNPVFRRAVLHYATQQADRDPASASLWPEVVYPLIERARWQRSLRTRAEAVWDAVAANLHLPDAGVALDRAIERAVPEAIVEDLDEDLSAFTDVPDLGPLLDEGESPQPGSGSRFAIPVRAESFDDIEHPGAAAAAEPGVIRIDPPDPFRFTLGEIRAIWQEAMASLRAGGTGKGVRALPIGPYRLAAIPSIRARNAGQAAIQGMPNKQLELLLPSFTGGGSSKLVAAVWLYENNSLVVSYLDNSSSPRFICWDAATSVQHTFEAADQLNHVLFQLGMEVPDQLDRVLTKRFRPRDPAA